MLFKDLALILCYLMAAHVELTYIQCLFFVPIIIRAINTFYYFTNLLILSLFKFLLR